MTAVDAAIQCPSCLAHFPSNDDALPVHLSACAPTDSVDAEYKHCLICFKAFGPVVPANEILFHKDECERVNGPPPKRTGAQKRRRGSDADKTPSSVPFSHVLPSPSRGVQTTVQSEAPLDYSTEDSTTTLCFLCGQGGRQLVICTATCARAFHVWCIGENAVLTQRQGQNSRRVWQCGECSRSVHTCSTSGCGLYCHDRCMADGPIDAAVAATFVCGRHTCRECNLPSATPSAPSDCIKCYKCATMVHKACQSKASFQPLFTNITGRFGDCGVHPAAPVPAHFKAKVSTHDIVVVLEFANNVLPMTARLYNGNQWGRVARVESLDGGAQLLSVVLFACGTTISVPGHCVLRTGGHYSLTAACLGECMTSHVQSEWNIRQRLANGQPLTDRQKADARMDTCLTFQHFGKLLKMTSTQLIELTEHANKTGAVALQPFTCLDTRRRRTMLAAQAHVPSKTCAISIL
ncbi:hypothetical protein, variant [Aphanomyces invadans]|uniref:PHD-type domain-containing protein n=1 Tax=Aphanomyces invadans TaxID=157072 RepID=A0A024UL56_9STRA|nr:hypothetical protein, variant [Aphanomyces invadans]ETW06890.1 hypothetical protein, variant [Aphanomyces invadans]|eukprot:XP_008864965.1 hypothetical protein, variant [Aphanomyces invadans]